MLPCVSFARPMRLQDVAQRQELAEGDEVALVVARHDGAGVIEHEQSVPGERRRAGQIESLAASKQEAARRHHLRDHLPGHRVLIEGIGAADSGQMTWLTGASVRRREREVAIEGAGAPFGLPFVLLRDVALNQAQAHGVDRLGHGIRQPQRAAGPDGDEDQAARRERLPARAFAGSSQTTGKAPSATASRLRPWMPVSAASWLIAVD